MRGEAGRTGRRGPAASAYFRDASVSEMNLSPPITVTAVPRFLEASASSGHLSSDLFSQTHLDFVTVVGKIPSQKAEFSSGS